MSCTQMINFVESLPTFGPKFMVYVGNYGPKILGIFIDFPLNLLWVDPGPFFSRARCWGILVFLFWHQHLQQG